MECNLKTLEDFTGFAFKTIKKKMSQSNVKQIRETPKEKFYDSREVLDALYADGRSTVGPVDKS